MTISNITQKTSKKSLLISLVNNTYKQQICLIIFFLMDIRIFGLTIFDWTVRKEILG